MSLYNICCYKRHTMSGSILMEKSLGERSKPKKNTLNMGSGILEDATFADFGTLSLHQSPVQPSTIPK